MILDNVNKENLISDLNNVFFSHNISADIKISKDDILRNAKDVVDGQIKLPKVVG